MWDKIYKAYKQLMPFLTLALTFLTVLIGWNQYHLAKQQNMQEMKRATIERLYSSVKDMDHEIAQIGHIGRLIMRRGLDIKEELKDTNKATYKLPNDYKDSLREFYKTWDSINTKLNTNMHSLSNHLIEKYQRLTYSIAFSRNETYPDPWRENYKLTMVIPEDGREITVGTEDRKILPYGDCFAVSQKIYDNPEYSPLISSKSQLNKFLDNCIDLGSYSFDVQDDLLVEVSNHLLEISFSQ